MNAQRQNSPDTESLMQRFERLATMKKRRNAAKADDLLFESYEENDRAAARALLEMASELDPCNVDVWLGLLRFEPLDRRTEIAFLRRFVAMAEEKLGKRAFREEKGAFWGSLKTRPYMRARSLLALRLMEAGRLEESVAEHEGMLELNPNDNQGVRYGLMALYLALSNLEGANRLFREYDERAHRAMFAWAYVMERCLAGDTEGAIQALAAARKQNTHAEPYFAGIKRLPRKMPGSYSIGSAEEAAIAWEILKPAWKKHPEVQAWLIGQRAK
jgi:tetratricopeptide (TPR) repeat protein